MELKENVLVAERFRLTRMIGRGGMGSVWAAQDCRLDNQCAVKFIEGEIANVADAQARFEREAKAAAQLRSPHVVEIKDYGVWAGRPYIAMELLEGEDLGKTLQRAGGKIHPAQVNAVIQQVCRALTKAHAAGIVHRDLKPDNIFLVTDDDRQLVKILDFGVAKQTSQAIEGSNTKTGAMLGTPYYMSPEQAQGIKSVDSRSDLWSLAVIVYHCVTGRLPFESEALGDLLVRIIVNPIPVPSQVGQVPPGFDRWWARAADRNPDNRFQTAKDFGLDLALALGATVDTGARVPAFLTGTAMMTTNVVQSTPNQFHNTPQPAGPGTGNAMGMGASVTPAMNTPHPMMNTPQASALARSAHMQGPPPNTPPPGLGGPTNPATFSGVEPPFTIPKKGPPVAILAIGGMFVVLALVGIGLVLARKPTTAANHPPPPVASLSATVAVDVPPPPPPPTDSTAASDPPPGGSSGAADPAPSASSSAVVAATAAAPTGAAPPTPPPPTHVVAHSSSSSGGTKPVVVPTKPTAAPTASAKKWNAGF